MKIKPVLKRLAVPSIFLLTGASILPGMAFANAGSYLDEAVVISANPVYRTVQVNEPIEQCWNERVVQSQSGHRSHTSTILGTIIGAAIGNKFSKGRGRDVATVAGAVLGGSVGRDVNASKRRHNERVHYEKRCEVVDQYHSEQQLSGYDVQYRYNGNIYNTHTQRHPGNRITVSVNVSPVE
ncbi:MAG: glycine zipper 2TM domain-containing protein [Gammaproteobacteria bacterium]|nr:glycine zipper 2TM domain-containing protein [Gammaproteobacteria bacterium]